MTVEIILIAIVGLGVAGLLFAVRSISKRMTEDQQALFHELAVLHGEMDKKHEELIIELREPPLDDSVKLKEEDAILEKYKNKEGFYSWEAFRRNAHKG
jgi:uncharacterized protein (UPF0335 family)